MGSPSIFKGTKTQLLTQEGIKLKNGANKDILVGAVDPTQVATLADAGSLYMRDGSNQIYKKMSDGSNTDWKLQGNDGPKDIYYTEDFESYNLTSTSTGNNASFGGAGAFQGTLALDTAAPMAELVSLTYTQAAGSLNDWFTLGAISVDKQAENYSGMALYMEYSGDPSDLRAVIWDATNLQVISSALDVLPVAGKPTRFVLGEGFYIPTGVTEIQVGIHTVVENIGAVLKLDDIELSTGPFSRTTMGSNTHAAKILNSGSASIVSNANEVIASVTRTALGFVDVVYKSGMFSVAPALAPGLTNETNRRSLEITTESPTGFTIRGFDTSDNSDEDLDFDITITAQGVDFIAPYVTPTQSNITDWAQYTPTFQGVGTPTAVNVEWKQIGDEVKLRGTFVLGVTTGTEAQLSLPNSYTIKSTDSTLISNGVWFRNVSSNDSGGAVLLTKDDGFVNFSAKEVFSDSATHSGTAQGGDSMGTSGQKVSFFVTVPVNELKSGASFLTAVASEEVVIFREIQVSGTQGGTFTSGSPVTRTLNNVVGNASLAVNRGTLSPGRWHIRSESPANAVNAHVAYIIIDPTGTPITYEGQAAYSDSSVDVVTVATVDVTIESLDPIVFEVQHECGSTKVTNGMGVASSLSTNETYTKVTARKLR